EPVVRPLLAQRRQELRVTGPADGAAADCKVVADPLRLGQVLINLMHNASKFGPAAAPIDVVVSAGGAGRACPPGFVRVVVADRGGGVPRGGAERLFLPFVRLVPGAETVDMAAATASMQGVGLGLSIVR